MKRSTTYTQTVREAIPHTLRVINTLKIPVYNSRAIAGDEPGYIGNIIYDRSVQTFFGHDGTTWVPFGGGDTVTNAEYVLTSANGSLPNSRVMGDGIGTLVTTAGGAVRTDLDSTVIGGGDAAGRAAVGIVPAAVGQQLQLRTITGDGNVSVSQAGGLITITGTGGGGGGSPGGENLQETLEIGNFSGNNDIVMTGDGAVGPPGQTSNIIMQAVNGARSDLLFQGGADSVASGRQGVISLDDNVTTRSIVVPTGLFNLMLNEEQTNLATLIATDGRSTINTQLPFDLIVGNSIQIRAGDAADPLIPIDPIDYIRSGNVYISGGNYNGPGTNTENQVQSGSVVISNGEHSSTNAQEVYPGGVYLRTHGNSDDSPPNNEIRSGPINIKSGSAVSNSGDVAVATGAITSGNGTSSGELSLNTGIAEGPDASSGNMFINTGNAQGNSSGLIRIRTGLLTNSAASGNSTGNIEIYTGDSSDTSGYLDIETGTGQVTGPITIQTGAASVADSGLLTVQTGSSAASSGVLTVQTGEASADSGMLLVQTGRSTAASSGDISLQSGRGINSGNATIGSGQADTGISGTVDITSGTAISGNTGTITMATGASGTGESGNVDLRTGLSAFNNTGAITLETGGTDLNTGDITMVTGTSVSNESGNIRLETGGANSDTGDITMVTGDSSSNVTGNVNITFSQTDHTLVGGEVVVSAVEQPHLITRSGVPSVGVPSPTPRMEILYQHANDPASPPAVTAQGTNTAFSMAIDNISGQVQSTFQITFGQIYSAQPIITFSPGNMDSTIVSAYIDNSSVTTSGFNFVVPGMSSGFYEFNFHVIAADGIINITEQVVGVECFTCDAKVAVPNGQRKIAEFQIGDEVVGYNPETGKTETDTITKVSKVTHDNLITLHLADGSEITSTRDHPYYVAEKGWASFSPAHTTAAYANYTSVASISIGDSLVTADGTVELVKTVDSPAAQTTYTLTLAQSPAFIVEGVVVGVEQVHGYCTVV